MVISQVTIPMSRFKRNMTSIMRRINKEDKAYVITLRGKKVFVIVPDYMVQ